MFWIEPKWNTLGSNHSWREDLLWNDSINKGRSEQIQFEMDYPLYLKDEVSRWKVTPEYKMNSAHVTNTPLSANGIL